MTLAVAFFLARCGPGLRPLSGGGVLQGGGVFSFAAQLTGATSDLTITLSNTGSGEISGMQAGSLRASAFSFKGGAFPGTGGTCGAVLAAGSSCTIVVSFRPLLSGAHASSLSIAYDGGVLELSLDGSALAGGLDPTFGSAGNGTAVVPVGTFGVSFARSVALQTDGKIISAGEAWAFQNVFSLVRHQSDGTVDSTFGTNGIMTHFPAGDGHSHLQDVAVQSDGKIVATGAYHVVGVPFLVVVRYLTNGAVDTSFGAAGLATTGGTSWGYKMQLQTDGKILAAGRQGLDFLVARFLTDGTLDNSFSGDGLAVFPVGTGVDVVTQMALQTDGKIVVVGESVNGPVQLGFARILTDGTLDGTFGTGGTQIHTFGSANKAFPEIALQSDGRIVVTAVYSNNQWLVARLSTDAALDSSFNAQGYLLPAIATTGSPQSLAIQPDGKIMVGGSAGGQPALARFLTSGSLDTSFGIAGLAVPTSTAVTGSVTALAFSSDGSVFGAGSIDSGPFQNLSAFHFLP